MNRTELVAAITEELKDAGFPATWTKAGTKQVLDTFENVVTTAISAGDPVTISGFCKFARVDRPARMGRNPATGEAIKIKAKSVVKVTPLKALKDKVLSSTSAAKKSTTKKAPAKTATKRR